MTSRIQIAICMILSAVIISGALSLGAVAAGHAAHQGYSVTITELQ